MQVPSPPQQLGWLQDTPFTAAPAPSDDDPLISCGSGRQKSNSLRSNILFMVQNCKFLLSFPICRTHPPYKSKYCWARQRSHVHLTPCAMAAAFSLSPQCRDWCLLPSKPRPATLSTAVKVTVHRKKSSRKQHCQLQRILPSLF